MVVSKLMKSSHVYNEDILRFVNRLSKYTENNINIYPDSHQKNWGFPSGISLKSSKNGYIFPGAVPDLGCGFRVVKTNIYRKEVNKDKSYELLEALELQTGYMSRIRKEKVATLDIEKILTEGPRYIINDCKIGTLDDLLYARELHSNINAHLEVSDEDKESLLEYFGICAGHFLEVRYVDEIIDRKTASKLNLEEGQLIIIIHSGITHGKKIMFENYFNYAIDEAVNNPEFELDDIYEGIFGMKINSDNGYKFLQASSALKNYGYASRLYAQYSIQDVFSAILDKSISLDVISDICHSKIQPFGDEGVLHARGLQSLFPKGHNKVMKRYREIGDIGLLAGEKGTHSTLIKANKNIELYDYQCSHGTGKYINRNENENIKFDNDAFCFDTDYTLSNYKDDVFNTEKTYDIVINELNLVSPIIKLAPYINFWGEKEEYAQGGE
ncbi:hypothetical protein ABD70_04485 [Alkalihalobacillus lehensis]|nr:hypothetical protein [Shouchella lehensis]